MNSYLITDPDIADADPDQWRLASSRAIHPSARSHDGPLVAEIAAGLAAVSLPWDLATGSAPDVRHYELLLETELYDAWLIYWPPGTGLEAHDHGGSAGAFAVVDGTLDEDTEINGSDTSTHRVSQGRTVWFEGDHVHAVRNRGSVGATSVHVYSPPLRTMGFYRPDASGRLIVDRVDELAAARQ